MSEHHPPAHEQPLTLRRRILQWTALTMGAIASAALGIPLVGYVLSIVINPKERDDLWIDLGPISQFPEQQTRLVDFELPPAHTQPWDGPTKKASAYVRNLGGGKFRIFAVNCAHLGCPVAWFPQSGLFMCPCHGGVYYEDGTRASGPPPRDLFEYETFEVFEDKTTKEKRLRILGGHLPTLQNTFPKVTKPSPGAKA
jgi:Rieske Fe-S protein